MALQMTLPQQIRSNSNAAPVPVPPLPQGAMNAQAGLSSHSLDPLVNAVMQAKMKQKLAGQLPGTTPQSLGQGTGMSDLGSATAPPPLNLGGQPLPNTVA